MQDEIELQGTVPGDEDRPALLPAQRAGEAATVGQQGLVRGRRPGQAGNADQERKHDAHTGPPMIGSFYRLRRANESSPVEQMNAYPPFCCRKSLGDSPVQRWNTRVKYDGLENPSLRLT